MTGWGILGAALAAIWAADAVRLRRRAKSLRVLAPCDAPASDDHVFLVRPGVVLDEPTRRSASDYLRQNELDALDLVSPRIATWRAMVLLVAIDPLRFRHDRFARGFSAGDAMLVRASLLDHLDVKPRVETAVAFTELARKLKLHAATSTDLVVAPRPACRPASPCANDGASCASSSAI